ncbi:MAG: HAMP domain-containing histidine kinase [Campylobacteraceae bacterium]|jgi:signal transduction histidine kinase|nr:HAMP domain-containing histidine kinase [Campylobacteraceae bacterium]
MEERHKAVHDILNWIEPNEKKIFKKDGIHVTKSVRFKVNIYNYKRELIYSDIKHPIKEPDFTMMLKYPNIYYQKEIKNNGELFYMIVELQLNYEKVIFIASMLLFVIPFVILIMSNLFLDVSVYPYKKIQKYMDDFFSDAMHELKTPLGVIGINIELLSSGGKNGKYIQRIKAAAKHMQITYEDIEYYIKHKILSYQKEFVDFSEYLKLRISFFEDIFISKAITIESKIEPMIFTDINKTELQRLIDNNVSNAVKYSFYKGKVEIVLKKTGDGLAQFIVKDEGEGIKDTKSIFKRFKREDSTQGGFGIGLNIVRNICKNNDIEIDVKSVKNYGTTFTYTFKLKR